jgi:hypothetical protein
MKWFHNDKVSLGWAILVEIAVHALFAFQAFLLGSFLGELALTVVFGPAGGVIGAWALAIFVFGAAFQAFVLGEYMREHVEAFEATSKGDGSYIQNWKLIRIAVSLIELSSLVFRCYIVWSVDHQPVQAAIIAVMGIVLLWYAFAQAKVIHASVNRPVEYDVAAMHQQTGHSIVKDTIKYIPKLSTEQKQRVYRGDLSPVDEAHSTEMARREAKLRPHQERQRREAEQQQDRKSSLEKGRDMVAQILGGSRQPVRDDPNFQKLNGHAGEPLSRNGRN